MQQSSATPKNRIGLQKIIAYSHSSSQCLLVPTVFGTVSSLHPTSFLMIIILVSLIFHPGLALTVARGANHDLQSLHRWRVQAYPVYGAYRVYRL